MHWSPDGTLLEINGARLRCVSADHGSHKTSANDIVILKPRGMIETYARRFAGVRNVLEFGFYEGGSPAFFAAGIGVDRYVGIDLQQPVAAFGDWMRKHPWGRRISLHYGVSQDDASAVSTIIAQEFGGQPIDLILDDASHWYAETRRSFELSFPFLKPGGTYVIEDWGWAHWTEEPWQTTKPWGDRHPPLSLLIFELAMVCASSRQMIANIELSGGLAFIRKGSAASVGGTINLDDCYKTQGRSLRFAPASETGKRP